MRTKYTIVLTLMTCCLTSFAQAQPADTVIVPLGRASQIIFTVQDRNDLEVLKHYNFQDLFEDLIGRLEQRHESQVPDNNRTTEEHDEDDAAEHEHDATAHNDEEEDDSEDEDDDGDDDNEDEEGEDDAEEQDEDGDADEHDEDNDEDYQSEKGRNGRIGHTWQSTNVDFGTNNFLQDGQFPDGSEPYTVRPWGSWYLALNSVQRTRLGRHFFAEWGLGVSWYTFKFQDHNMRLRQEADGLVFVEDTRDVNFIKSKLSATFINASLVPMLDVGDYIGKRRIWDGHASGFRFGIGPYVGYRISSKTKLVYKEDGDREKEKEHDNYYLNNLRYGLRLQLGLRSTDLFLNYDLNELFATDRGPRLNAVSFGLVF